VLKGKMMKHLAQIQNEFLRIAIDMGAYLTFDTFIRDKRFRSPKTGQLIEFGSLPGFMQSRIRSQFENMQNRALFQNIQERRSVM